MHCRLARNVSVLLSLSHPGWLSIERAANIFPRSRLPLFLSFTRVRLNNTKRGIQIPHTTKNRGPEMCDVLLGVPGCVTECDRGGDQNWPKIARRTLWTAP